MFPILNALIKRTKLTGLLIAVIALQACSDSNKNSALIFEELNESLESSNRIAVELINRNRKELQNYLNKGAIAYRAKYWLNKTDTISLLSEEVIEFISSMEKDSENKLDKSLEFKLRTLFKRLKNSNDSVINIDDRLKKRFLQKKDVIGKKYLLKYRNENEFASNIFSQFTLANFRNKMLQFKNDVRLAECDWISFCKDNYIEVDCMNYEIGSFLISQNKCQIKRREKLLIKAGIGVFFNYGNAVFNIDGKELKSELGYVLYEMNANGKLGMHQIPIKIEYTDINGKRDTSFDYVEYEIVK